MTELEAELGAAERHEFRTYRLGPNDGTVPECWCGWISPAEYISQDGAKRAHIRHQQQATGGDAMQRAYTPRLHP